MKEKKPKIKKPKPKSVDEAWCIERISSKGNLFYLQVEDTKRHAEESLRTQGRNSAVTYRIRKWKAVTVCEWRIGLCEDGTNTVLIGCQQTLRIGMIIEEDEVCCRFCGGKIRVRK